MPEKHWVDKDHYRVVSPDGSKSQLFETNHGVFSAFTDRCIEYTEHHEDGTTDAYERATGPISVITSKGIKKNND